MSIPRGAQSIFQYLEVKVGNTIDPNGVAPMDVGSLAKGGGGKGKCKDLSGGSKQHCKKCGKKGHWAKDCRSGAGGKGKGKGKTYDPNACANCGKRGH